MIKRSPNLTSRQLQTNQNSGRSKSLIAIALLLSSAGLATGGIWFSLQLFVNPNAVNWLNRWLPNWARISRVNQDSAQTLEQIATSLSAQGQIPGKALALETDPQTLQPSVLLLPVLSQQPQCQGYCQQIVELRLYQLSLAAKRRQLPSEQQSYQLINQLPVEGPEESAVIAPLVDAETSDYGSTRRLPLQQMHRYEGDLPDPGVWLYLLGYRQQGSTAIAYGQIIHYNPSRTHLSFMLPWSTPTGQIPQWQQVTGDSSPELVLDQTVDLEPQLRVYQVKPAAFFLNPFQLEAISLLEPALDAPAYQQAISLARSGLWSPSSQWLQFIQQQRQQQQQPWSATAQAQLDLIRLSAQFTQTQAEKTWSSPSQQVLTAIIDGRWGEALQIFEAAPENPPEIATLLAADSGQIWQRVEAALQANPARTEVKAWGTLLVAAQQGQVQAIAWLKQQPRTTPATISYIQPLLTQLVGNPALEQPPAEQLPPAEKVPLLPEDRQTTDSYQSNDEAAELLIAYLLQNYLP